LIKSSVFLVAQFCLLIVCAAVLDGLYNPEPFFDLAHVALMLSGYFWGLGTALLVDGG
jgi:hypothetical protein